MENKVINETLINRDTKYFTALEKLRNNEKIKVAFLTLGCKVNQYDTEAVIELFRAKNYEVVNFDAFADIYIVNTCTVTHLSDRKCRQMLRKTKKINPHHLLIAMGCYVQAVGEKIQQEVPEVDIIIGTHHRKEVVNIAENYIQNSLDTQLVEDIMKIEDFEELKISAMDERTRVYLKIQEGCNNYCTYCIIPYVRGKIRSRQEANVLEEATRLAKAGFKEIILTGIHVASYGKDLKNTSLLQVIQKLHDIEGIERIRLSSIEPVVLTETFINTLPSLPKLCRHFHLSLQSGCDTVLKRMNRKYTTAFYEERVAALRKVWEDVAITTDIIVGFPGETDEEFEETVAFTEKIAFAQVHIFPYSPREGTVAAKMENQVSAEAKESRSKVLKKIVSSLQQNFLKKHKEKEVTVLFESSLDGITQGYTSNYLKVCVPQDESLENTIQKVRIEEVTKKELKGKIIN